MQKWWTQQRSCEKLSTSISQTKSICRSSASATTIYVIRQDYECSICDTRKSETSMLKHAFEAAKNFFRVAHTAYGLQVWPTLGTLTGLFQSFRVCNQILFRVERVFPRCGAQKSHTKSPRLAKSSVTSTSRAEAMRSITPKTEMFAVGDIRHIGLGNLNQFRKFGNRYPFSTLLTSFILNTISYLIRYYIVCKYSFILYFNIKP